MNVSAVCYIIQVDETFNVPGTGLVLGGTLMRYYTLYTKRFSQDFAGSKVETNETVFKHVCQLDHVFRKM